MTAAYHRWLCTLSRAETLEGALFSEEPISEVREIKTMHAEFVWLG